MRGGQFFKKSPYFFQASSYFGEKKLAYEKQAALSSQFSTGGI